MTAQPPVGARVIELSRHGHAWRRETDGWHCDCCAKDPVDIPWDWTTVLDDIGATPYRITRPSIDHDDRSIDDQGATP